MRTTRLAQVVFALGLAAASTVSARTQAPADRAAVEKALIANEERVGAAIAKGDLKTVQSLIPTDAWSVAPEGLMSAPDFFKFVGSGVLKIAEYKLTDFRVVWADANTAVVAYTWVGKGTAGGQALPARVHSSTVWTKRGTTWLAVFHQETVAAAPTPPRKGATPSR